ncbi:hypothetical protein LCGC14_1585720 [marine sediment metagenome]|uniref:Uncharacterized protein n=1 Tax=marine sediment metagenome TaxID=412755 RepID=A0A0F9J1L6_9ZZZZ
MESRLCPVCNKGKVWLRHVRTCSRYCSRTWNTWSPEMQANAIEASQSTSIVDAEPLIKLPDSSDSAEKKPEFLK